MRLDDPLTAGPPPRVIKDVSLSTEQYSRLCQLQGGTKINGLNLRDALEQLIMSPGYDIDRRYTPDIPGEKGNPRTVAVDNIIKAYRQAVQARQSV